MWKSLSKTDKLGLSKVAEPARVAPAAYSSSMIAKQSGAMLECERLYTQWTDGFESFGSRQCGVDPAERRNKLESPISPGARACRLVDRKEIRANQAADGSDTTGVGPTACRPLLGRIIVRE